jgi:hypothetical protein
MYINCSKEPHSEINQSSTRPPSYSFHIHFNVILPNIPKSTKWSVSLELHGVKTYTTYVTTASNTSLLILHMSIRELHDRQPLYKVTTRGRRKALSTAYSWYVFVTLSSQHAMRMRHIVNCALPGSTFFHKSHKRHDFLGGGGGVTEHKTRDFSLQILYETFLILWWIQREKLNMYLLFTKSTRYSCQILMKLVISYREIFEIYSNVKFHKNPSSVSRVVPCTQRQRETWRS